MDAVPPPYHQATKYPKVIVNQPLRYPEYYANNTLPPVGEFCAASDGLRLDKAVRIGDRLIIDFEKIACCPWEVVGLDSHCRDHIPRELSVKGISQDTWTEWCDELMQAQKKSSSIVGCLCIFCFPGFIPQCILCTIFCPISAAHCLTWLPCCYGDWYVTLGKWMRKVNRELNQKDMHAKLKTYKPFQK